MKRIILDTDIGTNVDNVMAFSIATVSPELEIIGVTTVQVKFASHSHLKGGKYI